MTIEQAKEKLVAWARSQVGYTEGEQNWNKYAVGKAGAYGWDVQNQPWCDVFVDCGFIECFGLDDARKLTYQPTFSALCSASAQFYKNHNAWYQSPEVGDQVFFYVDGGINHTGIVVAVSGGLVTTVEGNSSDAVRMRVYANGVQTIAGYGRPNWSIFSSNVGTTQPVGDNPQTPINSGAGEKKITGLPNLQRGDKGEVVRAAQFLLNGRDCSVGMWGADADFGNATYLAVKTYQRRNGLDPDGIIGPATWASLLGVS